MEPIFFYDFYLRVVYSIIILNWFDVVNDRIWSQHCLDLLELSDHFFRLLLHELAVGLDVHG